MPINMKTLALNINMRIDALAVNSDLMLLAMLVSPIYLNKHRHEFKPAAMPVT